MQVKKIMIQKEIQICLNAITNDDFIAEYSQFHDSELLNVEMVSNICDWCVEYYGEFEKAPRKNIQKIFINKISGLSDEVQEQTKDFLSNLSDKYEKLEKIEDVDFEIKQAVEHLQKNKLKQTSMSINDSLDNIERAKEIIENHTNITRENNKVIDFFDDDKAIEDARLKAIEVEKESKILTSKEIADIVTTPIPIPAPVVASKKKVVEETVETAIPIPKEPTKEEKADHSMRHSDSPEHSVTPTMEEMIEGDSLALGDWVLTLEEWIKAKPEFELQIFNDRSDQMIKRIKTALDDCQGYIQAEIDESKKGDE
jgi:hypothetical protein